ncbi:MAG: primosomal protein [Pseudonocardiaceae bacterium]|nr:primosomal protein [Pseudonocardiaceae bacterium]
MAADILPIELGLTAGDLVTLWAPRWREEGEDWEAFLGDDEALFVFPDVAAMAAFVRTVPEHDLTDHPAWSVVPRLAAVDLVPEQIQHYDLVGVPELFTEDPDTWSIAELAEVVAMARSLADVCGLDVVHEVLDSSPGFAMLDGGTLPFGGREGSRLWEEMSGVVAQRWDEVLDAVDGVVRTPEVDSEAVAAAATELAEVAADGGPTALDDAPEAPEPAEEPQAAAEPQDPVLAFWAEVGIDPVRIVSSRGGHYTLRCYLDDAPLFLGRSGTIDVFGSPRALARHLAEGTDDHDLVTVATWSQVTDRANAGELEIRVDDANSYVLAGLADDLAEGPETVDPVQLDLAVELITDADEWAGSGDVPAALVASEPLGWLVSFVLRPDPTRLAPSPPFDAEVAAWRTLVTGFEDRLRPH